VSPLVRRSATTITTTPLHRPHGSETQSMALRTKRQQANQAQKYIIGFRSAVYVDVPPLRSTLAPVSVQVDRETEVSRYSVVSR